MNAPTKQLKTPNGNNEVVIKEWITGRDRQYIDGSMLQGIDARPRVQGKAMDMTVEKLDIEKFTNEATRRALEKFVVSVDGKTEGVVDLVLDLHEGDTAFVLAAIDETSKKKV